MLRIQIRVAAAGCSKTPRGLRLPLEVSGMCTGIVGSLGPGRGQRSTRSALHASRQLSGKVLRYLKRVIVTPAVYRRLAPLNEGLTYRHWADVTTRTHPYELAGCYVLVKQSVLPSHCDAFETNAHPIYLSYEASLPNSLDRGIPTHLRLLT
jgi:hypothetical protein